MSHDAGPCGVEVQGHRGARGLRPENTLEGFRVALELGVDTLELDVGMTRDGVVVVHHDPTLNPDTTRDAAGRWLQRDHRPALGTLTLAELRALDVSALRPGTAYARRFRAQRPAPGARIPTLEEVVALVCEPRWRRVRLNVELKSRPVEPVVTPPAEGFTDAVSGILRRAGIDGRCAIQSFDWRVPLRVLATAPAIRAGFLTVSRARENTLADRDGAPSPWTAGFRLADHGGSVPDMVRAAGGDVWGPHHADLTDGDLERAHGLGLLVAVWTVNAARDIRRAIRMRVDGIISDYPDRVIEALGRTRA